MHDCIHTCLISPDFRPSQENQCSQTLLPHHLGVAKSLLCPLCSCLSLPTTDSQHKANSVLLSHPLTNASCFWAAGIPQGTEFPMSPTTEVSVGKSGTLYPAGCFYSLEKSLFAVKYKDTRMGISIASSLLVAAQWQSPGANSNKKKQVFMYASYQLCNRGCPKESSPTAGSGCSHTHSDRPAVTNTYFLTNILTGLEHPTVDVLWRPETVVYKHNNVVSQLFTIIAGVKLVLII